MNENGKEENGVFSIFLDAVSKSSEINDLPIRLCRNNECGRFLVASRNIREGEVIFRERPIVMAPRGGSGAVCLDCFKTLPTTDWPVCDKCAGPKCQSDCTGVNHTDEECRILSTVFSRNVDKKSDIGWIKLINVVLTPLRTHIEMQKCDKIKRVVEALQSSVEDRKRTMICKFIDNQIVPFFDNHLSDLQIDATAIHHICGVFDTNSFEITYVPDATCRTLFSLSSLISHSCIPNTGHWFHRGYCVVRASVDISAGEVLTKSYTQGLWGTNARRTHLSLTKHFTCRCPRCEDPTECGSHLSSIKCHRCGQGQLVPSIEAKKLWICNICDETMSPASINSILTVTSGIVAMASNMDGEDLFKTIKRLTSMLGTKHSSVIDLLYIFVKYVSRHVLAVSNVCLRDAIETIPLLMDIANKLRPGITKLRGALLYHKLKIANELCKRVNDRDNNRDSEEMSASHWNHLLFTDVVDQTKECEEILKWDLLLEDVQKLSAELSMSLLEMES